MSMSLNSQLPPRGCPSAPPHERQGRDEASEGRAQRDERKGPLADIVGIEVVGEAPELGNDEIVEDADPDEEQDPHGLDGHAAGVKGVEDDEIGDEECRRPGDEDVAGDPGGQAAEGLDDEDEQDRLRSAQGALDDGGVLIDEQERFAQGLEDVIGEEQEEDVQGQEEGLGGFAMADVGEQPEELVAGIVARFGHLFPFPHGQKRTFASPRLLIIIRRRLMMNVRRVLRALISSGPR